MSFPTIKLTPDLHLRIGDAVASLTPAGGFRLAEQLTRASFRRILTEEAEAIERPTRRAPTARFTELQRKAKS